MTSADVVIVGGGVIGLSTAYHLACKQAGRIVLLEKGPVGDGSSSRAAGITSGFLSSETGVAARLIGAGLFRQLSDELEGYTYHNEHGSLNLYNPDQWSNFQRLIPMYDRLGAPYEILDAGEIRSRWPALSPSNDQTGMLDPNGGYSEPREYLTALDCRIRQLGVEVREGEKVVDFLMERGRVSGVRSETERYEAAAVVCTVHAWGSKLVGQLGWPVPVKYFVHQRYVTVPVTGSLAWPPVNANSHDAYVRPAAGNRILIGVTSLDREEYRVDSLDFHMSSLSAPLELRDNATNRLSNLVGQLKGVSWESEHVGLLGFSLDQEPIVGPIASLPGLFVGASFHSGGFSYNPVAGLFLAQCVVDGRTSIDISSFSPDRFDSQEIEADLARTVCQAEMETRRH